jgi:hypothetical protein
LHSQRIHQSATQKAVMATCLCLRQHLALRPCTNELVRPWPATYFNALIALTSCACMRFRMYLCVVCLAG